MLDKLNGFPRIGIVVPSYNSCATIGRTLESINNQTYRNFKVCLADNLSTDCTIDIFRRYFPDAPVLSRADLGIADALNEAFDLLSSSVDVLCWLNSDDKYYDQNALQDVAASANKNPSSHWFYGNSIFEHEDMKMTHVLIPHCPYCSNRFLDLNIFTGSMFFTTYAWKNFGGFSVKYKYAFEYELIKFLKTLRSTRVKSILAIFTWSKNSLSFKFWKEMESEALQIEPKYKIKPWYYYMFRIFERLFFR